MAEPVLQRSELLAAGMFVLTTAVALVVAWRLLVPAPVSVTIGADTVYAGTTRTVPRTVDVVVLTVAAFGSGASMATLLSGPRRTSALTQETTGSHHTAGGDQDPEPTEELLEARRREWNETADRLADTERIVYETVLEADGVLPQNEIVESTEFSKATVSRTLDTLEAKELIERKRRGVGNVVILL
jgi:uncharacterized membrane protein